MTPHIKDTIPKTYVLRIRFPAPNKVFFKLRIKETSLLRTIEDKNSWSQNVLYLEVPLYTVLTVNSVNSAMI